ncbi:major facilitator superfamily domain-containing protein [Thelonectria olida]|uniref:Major facilitator superfamily domain-containing protein n=1 Tax=Thelonectria olida TaxID=1576542 RepID=A0A9P8VNM5_9HYPO|nr:major facilitator superfamily domain-containing protein [Thelonectria olida]
MTVVTRVLSRAAAKPYRSAHIDPSIVHLNDSGYVDFAPDDVENPLNWSIPLRIYVTVVSVILVVNAAFASSCPSGSYQSISQHFNVSGEAAGLTVTLFLLGYVAGPLVFAPLSEFYGRRIIFWITFTLYLAFNFLCAFAPNFGSLLVGRFLTGTFVSSPLSNAPGVLADLWDPFSRGVAMAGFSCMVWVGPALGPLISGFLQLTENWRWGFYVIIWMGGGTALLMFTLPETYAPIILRNKARRIREAKVPGYENVKAPIEDTDRTITGVYKVALTRPWVILFDTISFICAIYLSFVYLLLYMLFSIYPIIFQRKRHWNSGVGQLPLIGAVIGALLGGVIVVMVSRRQAKKHRAGKVLTPEDRLILAMIGGIICPIAIFWFAWTGEYNSVPWIVPTIAGVFMCCGMMLIFVCYFNYIVDSYLMYAASAIAANTVARSAAGAAAPLFTDYMFEALGVGGGGSLLGGVATLLAIIPFVFYRYGERIRLNSKFAPTPALKKGSDDEETQQTGDDHTGRVLGSDAAFGEDPETAGSRSSSTIHEG